MRRQSRVPRPAEPLPGRTSATGSFRHPPPPLIVRKELLVTSASAPAARTTDLPLLESSAQLRSIETTSRCRQCCKLLLMHSLTRSTRSGKPPIRPSDPTALFSVSRSAPALRMLSADAAEMSLGCLHLFRRRSSSMRFLPTRLESIVLARLHFSPVHPNELPRFSQLRIRPPSARSCPLLMRLPRNRAPLLATALVETCRMQR